MAKKTTKKKSSGKAKKNLKYSCSQCGAVVSVDECGCEDTMSLVCCGEQMDKC